MTTDPEILDYISHCQIEFVDEPWKYSSLGQQHFNEQQQIIITTEVQKLLDLGAIERCEHIFVVPRSDGTYRLIFNFKKGKDVLFRHFKMDILSTVIGLITLDSCMASLDLKHACYGVREVFEIRMELSAL